MAIGRTARGTFTQAAGSPTLTCSVTVGTTGSTLVLALCSRAGSDPPDFVTWDIPGDNREFNRLPYLNIESICYYLPNMTAGTKDVVIDYSLTATDTANISVCFTEVTGADLVGPFDAASEGTGVSTTPSSGAATTVYANELLLAFLATSGAAADTAPTWGNSFTSGQRAGVGTGVSGATIAEAYQLVSATGSYTASASGITSRRWYCHLVSFAETGQVVVTNKSLFKTLVRPRKV